MHRQLGETWEDLPVAVFEGLSFKLHVCSEESDRLPILYTQGAYAFLVRDI